MDIKGSCLLSLLFFMVLSNAPGCGIFRKDHDKKASTVCARVNKKRIYLKDFQKELQRFNLNDDDIYTESEEQIRLLKKELLLYMVDKELLIQEAEARGIRVSDEDLEIFLRDIAKGYPFERLPIATRMKDPEYKKERAFFLEDILIMKLIKNVIEPKIKIGEEEMMIFFLTHKKEFERKRGFNARQIVVESEVEAQDCLRMVKKGYDFAKLAREKSLSPDREQGGDLGFFEHGQMPPEFDEVLDELKEGEISDVVQSDYGYHIFLLLEAREPKEATWEEAKPKIQEILRGIKRDEAFQDWLVQLRKRATLKIYPKAVMANE